MTQTAKPGRLDSRHANQDESTRRPGRAGHAPGGSTKDVGTPRPERSSTKDLGRAIRYLGHYKKNAILAYLFLFISTGAMLMVPQLMQRIINAVTNGVVARQLAAIPAGFLAMALQRLGWTAEQYAVNLNGAESALFNAGWLIVAFAVTRAAFAYAQTYISEKVSQSVAFDFRNDLFSKIQRLSFSYHDQNQTGQLMVRATDDVEKVRIFISQGLLMMTQAIVMLVASLVILFLTNARLALVVLPLLPVAMILFGVFSGMAAPLFREVQVRMSRLNTILQENLAGIKVVKAFAREPEQEKMFDQSADSLMQQHIKVSRIFSFIFPLVFLVMNLGQAALQYFGGRQMIMGTLTLGEWQKFTMYLMFVFFPLGMLGMIISQMAMASASAHRVFEILDAKNEVVNKPDAANLPPVVGRVEFKDVAFRYFGSGEPVLKDVDLVAEPGQVVALLGATGSGKSSIINLIPRFYDPTSGAVLIDGHDIREVCLDSLRSQIGIVLQDTTLFSGTIRDNIAFGRPEATLDEVITVARAASAHEFILGFPNGYDTRVGERGTTLSGGQKQRIAIARALLMDPRILILDDSTSSVDAVTEYEIQQTLTHLMKGRTSLVIAQRISTVRMADQILVLDKGQIVARGCHDDLMENSPAYAEIYNSQLVEDAPGAKEAL